MRRRRYLALAGSALLAGCGSDSEATPTVTSSEAETPSQTPTDTPTSTPTKTETDTPTETPTETETEAPTPDPRDEDLDEIESHLADAIEAYEDIAMNVAIDGLLATDIVSVEAIREHLYEARDARRSVEGVDLTDDQAARRGRLQGIYWFLWWAGDVHSRLNDAYRDLSDSPSDAAATADDARSPLGDLRDDSDPSDTAAVDALSEAEYKNRVALFDREIDQFKEFETIAEKVAEADGQYADAEHDYEDENYTDASAAYYEAGITYDEIPPLLDDVNWTETFQDEVDAIRCRVEYQTQKAEHMDTAATAGANGNEEKQSTAEQQAADVSTECE